MTTTSTTIRPLCYSDLPQVIAIERRAFPSPWSLAMFVLELSKPSGINLAAVAADDKLIGYLICTRYDQVWHLMNIAVDPIARRIRVGSALLDEMVAQGGVDAPYTLEVRTSNTAAIALYERFRFRPTGTRPRYYHDTGEDAMIMWRTGETASTSGVSR